MILLQLEAVRLLLRGLVLGVLGALLALGLSNLGALAPLERGSSSALFLLRGPRAPGSKVVLLVIDEATLARSRRPLLPRRFYAQTLQKLRSEGARVVAFNFVFGSASGDVTQDALLAKEFAARGDVTQGVIFDAPEGAPEGAPDAAALRLWPDIALGDQGARARLALSVAAPFAAMRVRESGIGHLNFRPEAGGEVRRIPHLIRFGEQLYPSLSLSAAIKASGHKASDWIATRSQIAAPGGDLTVPLDANGETLVNWLGGDGIFPTYSMVDLLDGLVPRGALQGATVMVGNARAGTFSTLVTPFSSRAYNNQSALHLQANAFDDIVSGRVLRPLPALWQGLIVLIFSLGAGVVIARRGAMGALFWIVAGSLALWSIGVLLLLANFFLPIATPQIALILTGAACLGVRQQREARELRLMHDLFHGYVGQDVLQLIKTSRPKPKLDGELRQVTILFCDIRGFSGLAETFRDDPEKLLRLLNDHFEPLIQSLQHHGAHVDNFVGDLVMAIFGAPLSVQTADSNTRSAVLAALDVLAIVARRNQEREARGEPRIDVGVGVHCGPAVVGDLGASRKHYTALGDTVNIASRIEGETRIYRTGLLVTEEVVRACRDHPDTSHLPWGFVAQTPVKGRQSVVTLFSNPNFDG